MGWGGSGRRQWARGGFCLFQVLWTDSSVISPHLDLAGVPWMACLELRPASTSLNPRQPLLEWSKEPSLADGGRVGNTALRRSQCGVLHLERELQKLLVIWRASTRGYWSHRSVALRTLLGNELKSLALTLGWAFSHVMLLTPIHVTVPLLCSHWTTI